MKKTPAALAVLLLVACISSTSEINFHIDPPASPGLESASNLPPGLRLPGPVVPDGLGVEVHFVRSNPAQMDAIAAAGFRFVRMDMTWERIERAAGTYDFSRYDGLVQGMQQRGIRIIFILDYANPLYDDDMAPHTDAGRSAFAAFAAAAAAHYAGDGIVWEVWNEPDTARFWSPRPNAADYAALAEKTMPAIRRADPHALVIGPALCCLGDSTGWDFIETLGRLGVLGLFDAVSVHPYQDAAPETVYAQYDRLRALLDRYSPGRKIPIVSSEWGYSVAGSGQSDQQQAEYLARAWIMNITNGVDLSIWYDWKDDCFATNDPECHFGTVDIHLNPKPAYQAASTLTHTLDGYSYVRQIATRNENDCLYLFSKGNDSILAAWTTGAGHAVTPPLSGDALTAVSLTGAAGQLAPGRNGFAVELGASPQYLLLGAQSLPASLGG